MARLTRGAALAGLGAIGAGSVLSLGYVFRNLFEPPSAMRLTDGGVCGWGWGGNGWGWRGIVMTIGLAVFLVAVIVAVVFAIRDLARGGSRYNGASPAATGPEDTLAQRFARGEVDEDGYRRRIALLSEHL